MSESESLFVWKKKTELLNNNSQSLTKNNFVKPGKRKKQKKKYGNLVFVKKSVLNLFIESKYTRAFAHKHVCMQWKNKIYNTTNESSSQVANIFFCEIIHTSVDGVNLLASFYFIISATHICWGSNGLLFLR